MSQTFALRLFHRWTHEINPTDLRNVIWHVRVSDNRFDNPMSANLQGGGPEPIREHLGLAVV